MVSCTPGALSNIPQFFQHLRSNLEALQFEEDDDDSEETDSGRTMGQSDSGVYGNDDETKVLNIPQPAGKKSEIFFLLLRWED